jgi:signal transduction histidine kinase
MRALPIENGSWRRGNQLGMSLDAAMPRHANRWSTVRLLTLVWAAAAVVAVALYAAGTPTLFSQIEELCAGPECPYFRVDVAMAESLRGLGLSLHSFALLVVGLDTLPLLVCLSVSVLLVWRRSADPMALFAAIMLVTFGGTVLQSSITALANEPGWRWPVAIVQFTGSATLFWFFCLFPNGTFVPHWTRWLVVGWIVWCALGYFSPLDWPVNQRPPGSWFLPGVALFFLATVAAQVVRYARISTEAQRQQTKWVLFGFSISIAGILIDFLLLPRFSPPPPDPAAAAHLMLNGIIFDISLLLIPVSIAVAVLRYRLFDIDVLISRTVVYGGLTAIVVGLYVIVVGYLGSLLRTGNNVPVSLVATGLIAVAFQPVRDWLQRSVNRLIYGERDNPYAVLSRLGERLEGTLTPEVLLPAVVQTIGEALKLPYAAIVLLNSEDNDQVPAATYGEVSSIVEFFPMVYGNEPVGELRLAPRSGTGGFGAADRRLLSDIARQAAAAAHAVRLSTDLQHSRERLVAAREEERRRLRRDLHDGLGPTLAAQALKIGSARALYARDHDAADKLLLQLESDMETTLEEVRRLAYDLRPPSLDQLGLGGAMRELATRYEPRISTSIQMMGDPTSLPAGVEVAAYRIADEALTNVVRHANAEHCQISITIDDALRLEVADDGVGLPERPRPGIGLTSMRERAEELGGRFGMEPNLQRGTRIIVELPLPKASP